MAMKHSDPNVFAALAVNKTPNLRMLYLPGGQIITKPFDQLFSRVPEFLSSIEYFDLHCDSDDAFCGYNIAVYKNFLTRPKLVTATFEYGDLYDHVFPSNWSTGSLAIQRVAFNYCHIQAGAFQKFMKACKKLTSFSYGNFTLDPREGRSDTTGPEFNAAKAQKAALVHKSTLEQFRLEIARDPWELENLEDYLSRQAKVGSFCEFSALKRLSISHAVLPAHPQFPSSLEELVIADCNSSVTEMVQNIATDCKNGLYPNLAEFKILTIDVTRPIKLPGQVVPPGKTPEQCFLSLRNLFDGTSVDFMIAPYILPDFDDYDDSDPDMDEEAYEDYLIGMGAPGMENVPPAFLDLLMHAALQNHLDPPTAESDDSWETESDE